MPTMTELLMSQLGGSSVDQIARQIGAEPAQVGTAISGAVPVLMGALSRNAADAGGSQSLLSALDRDHDGSILDDVAGFLGSGDASPGGAILGHVLGSRQGAVQSGLARSSGLSQGQVGQLLMMLAPLVLGLLGKQRRTAGFDAGGLASVLAGETRQLERSAPGVGGLLGSLLDADGDGLDVGDLTKLGGGLFGKLLG